jgi:predicted RNA-binding protein with TRAM domain
MAILDTLRFNTIAESERISVIEEFVVLTPPKKIGKVRGVEVRRVGEVFASSLSLTI